MIAPSPSNGVRHLPATHTIHVPRQPAKVRAQAQPMHGNTPPGLAPHAPTTIGPHTPTPIHTRTVAQIHSNTRTQDNLTTTTPALVHTLIISAFLHTSVSEARPAGRQRKKTVRWTASAMSPPSSVPSNWLASSRCPWVYSEGGVVARDQVKNEPRHLSRRGVCEWLGEDCRVGRVR